MPRRRSLPPTLPEADVQRSILATAPLYDVVLRRRNTGAAPNPNGRWVRYGERGDSDLAGYCGRSWGPMAGRSLAVECKREGWRPPGPTAKARARWELQLGKLRAVNAAGGFGWWSDHPDHFADTLRHLRTGLYRIEFDAGEVTILIPLEEDAR